MTREQKIEHYNNLLHAMQSGVQMMRTKGFLRETEPKHLRVGVNTAKCDHGALIKLLVAKGVISDEEYLDAIIEIMELEVKAYEEKLSERLGAEIKLF